jgi:acyl carrier protein
MTREEVLELIRSHLSDELEIEPGRISEQTRFKEDLDADSLDLYTLVQELEDSYGVRIPDEEAARILTVGQAVDFILAHPAVDRQPRP